MFCELLDGDEVYSALDSENFLLYWSEDGLQLQDYETGVLYEPEESLDLFIDLMDLVDTMFKGNEALEDVCVLYDGYYHVFVITWDVFE